MLRVFGDAIHRANFDALRLLEMAHTLGALVRLNFIELGSHAYGLVGALGFAHIAVDAGICDHQSHDRITFLKLFFACDQKLEATQIAPHPPRAWRSHEPMCWTHTAVGQKC